MTQAALSAPVTQGTTATGKLLGLLALCASYFVLQLFHDPSSCSFNGSAQDCTIAVNSSAASPIHVESFSTEGSYDNLLVNCEAYSGIVGPQGVIPDTTIYWYADGSVVSSGWRICPSEQTKS